MGKGILLGDDGDLKAINGSLVVGDSEMQEVAIILSLNQGELKYEPLLGPNLTQLIKSNVSMLEIEQRVKTHLAKDNKEYAQIKNKIKISLR